MLKILPRFVTKKWIEVYDQSRRNSYNFNKEIRIKTPMFLMLKIYQDLLLKNGFKFMFNQEEIVTMLTKKLELKHQC